MKKLLAMILAVAMLPVFALADVDVTSMSDQELKDLISACSQELMARNTSEPEGILIFEYEGIRVFQTGEAYISYGSIYVPIAVYSDLDYEAYIFPDVCTCNGWDIFCGGTNVTAKAKKKGELNFGVESADVTSIEQIDSLRFSWEIQNFDNYTITFKEEKPEERRFW